MKSYLLIALILLFAGLVVRIVVFIRQIPQRRAGKEGEKEAANLIRSVLNKEDYLILNAEISFEGKKTELDNLVVNSYGVFIIEVKNYSGKLTGKADDPEWKKYHVSSGGNIYEKNVRNPLKQVNRQVYILSHYLKEHKIRTWIDGYIYLIENNSPVNTPQVLNSMQEIKDKLHTRSRNAPDKETIEKIVKLLS